MGEKNRKPKIANMQLIDISRVLMITLLMVSMIFVFVGCSVKEIRETVVNSKDQPGKDQSNDTDAEDLDVETDVVEEEEAMMIMEGAKLIQINNNITHQRIEGFGASYAWYTDWMTNNPNDHEAYDLMFSMAKTTILRFKNTYKYNNRFDPKPELKVYQEAKKRAETNGEEVIVLMSSWSPASDLKENGKLVGGSSLKKDEKGNYMYKEYGQYWLELVEAYEAYGIPIDYISIQNECDFTADYDGMEFGMVETDTLASYSKAYLAVYEALKTMENPPKMMGPETMTIDAGQIAAYMKEVFDKAPESVYGIAHHLYAGGTHETPNSYMTHMFKLKDEYPDLAKWQTEFYRGDVMQTVWIMHNSFTMENLNAYLYWDGVWAYPGNILGFENPWSKASWIEEKGYRIGDNYYAIRHFSEFIRPGYKRIDVAPTKDVDLLVSAYASEKQDKIAVIAINKSSDDKLVQLNFSAFHLEDSNTYISTCQEGYTQENLYVSSGPLAEHQSILIPANGIVTMDLSGKAAEGIEIKDGTGNGTKVDNSLTEVKKIQINSKNISLGEESNVIWNSQTSERIENVANGDHGATGEFEALWSKEALYIRIQVKDDTPDTSADDYRNQDSIEVFLNEDHTKPARYGKGDQHYIITRDNQVWAGQGADLSQFQSKVTADTNGYVVELAIPFSDLAPSKGAQLGFDIQINDSHGKGLRNYALKWSTTSLNTDQSLEGIGTLVLN